MGTTVEKLNAVRTSKENMKQKFNEKGVPVDDCVPFSEYPDKMDELSGGVKDTVVTNTVNQNTCKNINDIITFHLSETEYTKCLKSSDLLNLIKTSPIDGYALAAVTSTQSIDVAGNWTHLHTSNMLNKKYMHLYYRQVTNGEEVWLGIRQDVDKEIYANCVFVECNGLSYNKGTEILGYDKSNLTVRKPYEKCIWIMSIYDYSNNDTCIPWVCDNLTPICIAESKPIQCMFIDFETEKTTRNINTYVTNYITSSSRYCIDCVEVL